MNSDDGDSNEGERSSSEETKPVHKKSKAATVEEPKFLAFDPRTAVPLFF